MDLDSPLARKEAKWSSTPCCRPLSACRIKMHLPSKKPTKDAVFFRLFKLPKPSWLH